MKNKILSNCVPKNWIIVPLSKLCKDIVGGGTPSTKIKKYWEGTIPWISSADIINIKEVSPRRCVTSEATYDSATNVVPKGTIIVVTRVGLGKITVAPYDLCFSQDNQGLIFHEGLVLTNYALFCLSLAVDNFKFSGRGTTINGVTKKQLRDTPFSLPPLPEQRAIVGKIELLFSELDDGIANLKKAQEQLKIYRQAVLKNAFEGELTKQWREQQTNLPTAQDLLNEIKKERGAATKPNSNKTKPIKPLTEAEIAKLPKLPESWTWVKSAEVIDPINNGYTPKAQFLSPDSGEVPFIKVYNLTFDGTFNFAKNPTFIPLKIHKKELARSVAYPGDVLINIVGPPLGKVSRVTDQYLEWNINQAIVLFRPNKWISSKYISYSLQNPITIAWLKATSKATAGQFNVKVSTCREIPIPFCPEDEQLQVAQEIETRLSVCDNIEASIKEALFKAKALRQSILKNAFEGKLLNDQELEETHRAPDWQPANQLLERIKTDRTSAKIMRCDVG